MMQLKLRRSVVQGTPKQLHPATALRAQDSDRSQSEVRCTHGGQPNELVQSPSEKEAIKLVASGQKTAAEVARLFKIHRSTMSRLLDKKT